MGFLSFLLIVVLGGLVALFIQTHRIEASAEQKEFLAGTVPSPVPQGLMKGEVPRMDTPPGGWKGKFFNADGTGRNMFESNGVRTEKYPFRLVPATGLRDHKDVLRIDYDIAGNPFWLRMITDEIVQTAPGVFLGKLHVRILPGIPFSLAFFRLRS